LAGSISTPAGTTTDPWRAAPSVLDGLGAKAHARLVGIAETRTFATGATILQEGRPTPFLATVLAGRVGLRLVVPERGPQTVVTVEPGELLGWSAVVAPYRATSEAVALGPTRLETIEAGALRALLAADPDLAGELLPLVLACLSDRLTTSWHQLLDLFGGEPGGEAS
jgi:CRP/FNR family transcriptional regulator, cyclic AMP receptor protein